MTTTLSAELILFRCAPFTAWIPKRQCETNRAKFKEANKSKRFNGTMTNEAVNAIALKPCMTCPGVEALAEAGGSQPRPASDLRAIERTPEARGSPIVRREFKQKPRSIAANVGEMMRSKAKGEQRMTKPRKGPCTLGHTSGKNAEGSCLECRRIYNRERYYARIGKPVPEVMRAQGRKRGPPVTAAVLDTVKPQALSVSAVLADLRARRAAVEAELRKIDDAILAVERAEEILGRPAA